MPAPTSGDPLIGQVVDDRYRIRRVIGRGGMGVVYEAEATRLGKRLCAVKVLLPEFTRNETAVARFAREAQVAARVKHPNVVEIFDTGTTKDGLGYIAMELLSGESLDRTLQREGTLPWPRAQRVIVQICRALAAAHAQGIVHRDMKPENCFRCSRDEEDDFIKVLDFGIAKLTDPESSPEAGRLTATNSVIGTYSYMAYEQICGEEVDHRVDVWATGVIMYELLTGQLPFRGNNQGQIWRAITEYDPAPMRNLAPLAGIPAALEPVVRQALARKLANRYPSIEALARAVAGVQADGNIRSVTGKLAALSHADATAATIGVAATLAIDAPRLSQRTAPVSPEGLTQLLPAEVSDTNETVVRAVSPSTAPDHQTQLAPVRPESMQTAIAESPAASEVARTRRGPRRLALLLAGLGLPAAALTVMLSQGTAEPVTAAPPIVESTVPPGSPAPVMDQAPDAVLSASPTPAPALPPEPMVTKPAEPTQESGTTRKPSSPRVVKPAPKKTEESFSVRAGKALKRLADSKNIGDCFTNNKVLAPLTLEIVQITAATGAVQVTVPPYKRNSGLALCIEREFKRWTPPRGNPGDPNYEVKKYILSPP